MTEAEQTIVEWFLAIEDMKKTELDESSDGVDAWWNACDRQQKAHGKLMEHAKRLATT